MHQVPLETLLALGWSESVRHRLADAAIDPGVACLIAIEADGRRSVRLFDVVPDPLPDDTVAYWARSERATRSRTAEAVLLVLRDGMTPYAAARQVGVKSQAVYRALRTRRSREPSDA